MLLLRTVGFLDLNGFRSSGLGCGALQGFRDSWCLGFLALGSFIALGQ